MQETEKLNSQFCSRTKITKFWSEEKGYQILSSPQTTRVFSGPRRKVIKLFLVRGQEYISRRALVCHPVNHPRSSSLKNHRFLTGQSWLSE